MIKNNKARVQRNLRTAWRLLAVGAIIATNYLIVAVPALADVSAPTVSVSPAIMSGNATYTIAFNTTRQLGAGGNINIAFPSDTTVQTGNITNNVSVTIAAATNSTASIVGLDASGDNTTRTIIIKLNSSNLQIGEGFQVTVVIGSQIIRNPSHPGTYSLNVSTSNETVPVTSASYAITLPTLGPKIPPQVVGKNAAGEIVFNKGTWDLNEAINAPNVTRIEVGTFGGGFNTTINANVSGQTIVATGGGDLFYVPPGGLVLSVSADNVTIIGFKIHGDSSVTANAVLVTGRNESIQNCTLERSVSSSGSLALSGCYFSGNGSGISVTNGTATISKSIFPSVSNNALFVSGGNVTVNDCTFTGAVQNVSAAEGVITVSGGSLIMAGNIIAPAEGSNFIFHISGGSITARYNSLSNAMVVRLTSGTADFARNWWGTPAGPAQSSLNGTVSFAPFLNAPVTGGRIAQNAGNLTAGNSLVGVDVVCTKDGTGEAAAAGMIAASVYSSNPLSTNPGVVITYAYYDVYVSQPADGSIITMKFYIPGITDSTLVKFATPAGTWSTIDNWGINVTGGYAYATFAGSSRPSITDLAGTIIAITDNSHGPPNVVSPSLPAPPSLIAPPDGATSFSISPKFIWTQTQGSYDFQLSTSRTFETLTANISQLTGNTLQLPGNLAGSTTYFWRVRANIGALPGTWVTSTFTTAAFVNSTAINVTPPPPQYNLAINTTGSGSAIGAGTYGSWTIVTITAIPEPGWQFSGWNGNVVANASSANTTIIMDSNKGMTAVFVPIPPAVDHIGPPPAAAGDNQARQKLIPQFWLFIIAGSAVIVVAVLLTIRKGKEL